MTPLELCMLIANSNLPQFGKFVGGLTQDYQAVEMRHSTNFMALIKRRDLYRAAGFKSFLVRDETVYYWYVCMPNFHHGLEHKEFTG